MTVNAENILFMKASSERKDETYIFFANDKLIVKGGVDEVRRKIVNTPHV